MTTPLRTTVFQSDRARIEVFCSELDGRVEAIVVYAAGDVGVLRMPETMGEAVGADTLVTGNEPTAPGTA